MGEQLNKLRATRAELTVTRAELTVRTGREPEPLELAEFPRTDLEDVERALAVPAEPTNLDAPVGTGDAAGGRGKTTGVDLVAKRAGYTSVPAALTLSLHPRPEIEAALLAIEGERLRLVLVHRYGLDGGKSKTLQEVA